MKRMMEKNIPKLFLNSNSCHIHDPLFMCVNHEVMIVDYSSKAFPYQI